MKLGLNLPIAGHDTSPALIARVAEEAERIGLDSVWTADCLLRPTRQPIDFGNGMTIEMPPETASQYEPLETLSYLAGRTARILLGTSVIVSVLQNPPALARRLATLDQLSGGRLIAGLGQGWIPEAFQAAGVPMQRRGAGYEEHVRAMRACWAPDPVRFDGRFYQIPESEIGPKPVRAGGPLVLLGVASPQGVERAARLGTGINPVFWDWDTLTGLIETFRRAERAAGHEPGALPVVVRVNGEIGERPPAGRRPLTGAADQVAEDVERLRGLGVDHVFWAMFTTGPDAQLDAMRRLRAAVG
jgi:probable F420-dependent oxidoreductase